MSMGTWQESEDESDIECVLYVFVTLTNCTKATIELPDSVPGNSVLHDQSHYTLEAKKARHELSVTNVKPLDEKLVRDIVDTLEEDLDDHESGMGRATGEEVLI